MSIVKDIVVYPIKGLSGIHVNEWSAEYMGLRQDRRLMLVDKEGTFLSQRSHPKMALIKMFFTDDGFIAKYDAQEQEIFELAPIRSEMITSVWEHSIQSFVLDTPASIWFSNLLDQEVHLVKIPGASSRTKYFGPDPGQSPLSFADGYPVLALGTSSWSNLNNKLENPVSIDRFRANIILETLEAHEEDVYAPFKIGTAHFQSIKPCVRCQVINIDPLTGVSSKEPMKTLATYRKEKNKVNFGANLIVRKEGKFRVGDKVDFL